MNHLIANPLTRAAIASLAVWLASILMAHGQDASNNLKQPILRSHHLLVTGAARCSH